MPKANSSVVPIDCVLSLRKLVEDALASAIVSGEMAPGELFVLRADAGPALQGLDHARA